MSPERNCKAVLPRVSGFTTTEGVGDAGSKLTVNVTNPTKFCGIMMGLGAAATLKTIGAALRVDRKTRIDRTTLRPTTIRRHTAMLIRASPRKGCSPALGT